MEDKKLVPRLRFPEFSSEWKKSKLGDLINHIGGTSLEEHVTNGGTHKFISIGNYHPNGTYIDDGKRINKNDKTKTKLLNKDDLVMVLNDKTLSGDIIGSTIMIDKDDTYIYNQRSERITVKYHIVLPHFLWIALNTTKFRKTLVHMAQGNTQIYVNFPIVKRLDISVPSQIHEQQKIADFLTKVDAWLTNLKSQKQELESCKKGLTQKIFSRKIRFKYENNNDYPVWEFKKISDIFEIKAGGDFDPSTFSKTKTVLHKYPIFANALTNKGLYGYSSRATINQECVTVTGRGDVGHAIARNSDFTPIVRLLTLIPKQKASVYFYECVINQTKIFVESTGVPQLTAPQLSVYKIPSLNLEEQQKIADLLTSVDKVIESKQNQIREAEIWKKGLLQQMFI